MGDLNIKPVWDGVLLPAFPALDSDVSVDVVVIGAGITGLTAAYLLKQSGCRVALLERHKVGGTDTGCTSAHLTVVLDEDLSSLSSSFGQDHARAAWDAGFAAIHQIDTNVTGLGIDCEFDWVPGFRHIPADCDESTIEDECRALDDEAGLARELGFDVTSVPRTPLIDRPGWRIENQAVFHPRKYLRGLVTAIPGGGSLVCEDSEATFDDEGTCFVGPHQVRAPWVVIATHNPRIGRSKTVSAALLQTRLGLFTSYVASASLKGDDGLLGCYWDTSSPYRYVRVDRTGQGLRVIAGGEDHKTGQTDDTRGSYAALERWVTPLVDGSICNRWSGQVIETNDKLPIIGEVAGKQFIGTGFAGNGMTFGTLTAMMARDAITGARNPWSELFGPDRLALAHKPWDYLRQNADYPYYLVRDRFAGADSRTLRSVYRGSGRIVDVNGQLVAAFRDTEGTITTLSPTCTHMGCRVGWNAAEKTWDCPCHGSRFTSTGEVLAGPAERPLERVDIEPADARERAAPASSRAR